MGAMFGAAGTVPGVSCTGCEGLPSWSFVAATGATAVPQDVQNFASSGSLCPQLVQWDMTAFLGHSEDLLPRDADLGPKMKELLVLEGKKGIHRGVRAV